MRTAWRVSPPPHLAAAVRELALQEGRSDTQMLNRLVSEALEHRRRAEASMNRLVDVIKGMAA